MVTVIAGWLELDEIQQGMSRLKKNLPVRLVVK